MMMLMSAVLSFPDLPPKGLSPERIGRLVRCSAHLIDFVQVPDTTSGESQQRMGMEEAIEKARSVIEARVREIKSETGQL
ncbi:MAG TPA: hypothetical protein VKC63_07545 [Solirubrobacterales bacterium]|nr:hypothetical protein [Solirubrobacterales bacterium]